MNTENLEFVILAAGKSTRNYPHSKGIPHKSLIPFGSIKIIDFIMKQILNTGAKHITIVVADNAAIESFQQCFKKEPDIEEKFKSKGKTTSLELLQSVYIPDDVEIKYLIQEKPKGTGHAVGKVYEQIKSFDRNIVMIWPDDIILNTDNTPSIYKRAIDTYISQGCKGNLGITHTVEDPSRWGIIDEGIFKEKPKQSNSHQAAFGLFIFDKKVCEKLSISANLLDNQKEVDGLVGGELAFADALNKTITEDPLNQKITVVPMSNSDIYLDCGCIEGYEKALLYTLLKISKFKEDNLDYLKQII